MVESPPNNNYLNTTRSSFCIFGTLKDVVAIVAAPPWKTILLRQKINGVVSEGTLV